MQSWACESKSKRAQSIQDVVPCVPEKFTDFASLIPGVEDRMAAIFQHYEDEGIKKPEFLLFRTENDSFQRLGVEKARKIWDSLRLSFIETCEGLDNTCTWMVSVLCSISFSALGRGVLHIPNDSIWRDGVQEDRWSEDRNLRCRELQDAATWAGFIRSVLGMPRHAVPKQILI